MQCQCYLVVYWQCNSYRRDPGSEPNSESESPRVGRELSFLVGPHLQPSLYWFELITRDARSPGIGRSPPPLLYHSCGVPGIGCVAVVSHGGFIVLVSNCHNQTSDGVCRHFLYSPLF